MKTILTFFAAGILGVVGLSASQATAAPAQILTDLGGTVHIRQAVPCGDPVDLTTSITGGRVEISAQSTREGVVFDLTRLSMFLSPFSVRRSCMGLKAFADFTEIGVALAGAVRFQGHAVPGDGPRRLGFTIPKESFLIFESVTDNQNARRPETAYQRPSEDVVGSIELAPVEGVIVVKSLQLHVGLRTQMHFQAGCLPGGRCRIDEIDEGTQTSDLVAGALGADTMPPTVACTRVDPAGSTAPVGNEGAGGFLFRASASDTGGAPTIHLGSYVLGNGEIVRIIQTGKPGVRLVGAAQPEKIRRFHVGRGENFVSATDPSGNTATASCR